MVNKKITLTCPRTGEPLIITISAGGAIKLDGKYHQIKLYTPEQYDALPIWSKMEWRIK